MSDPLSDPRAQALQDASPGEAGDLAGHFRSVAQQAGDAATGLRGARDDGDWTGQAASDFRTKLGELPGDLDKVQQFNEGLANSLSRYETDLDPIQRTFVNLVPQIQSARSSLSTAQNQVSSAQGQLKSAQSATGAKPSDPAVTSAHTAVQSANAAAGRAQDEVSGLESQAYKLLDEFDTVRHNAQHGISSAASNAPSPPGFFSSLLHGVEDLMKDVGHVAVAFVKNIAHAFVDIGPALKTLWEHPGNLDNWVRVLADVGTIAGAVAMVVAPFAAPALGGLEIAAETADVATAVGVGSSAAKGGIELGEGRTGAGLFDIASAAVGGLGVGGNGEALDASVMASRTAERSGALETYGYARAVGATHDEALSNPALSLTTPKFSPIKPGTWLGKPTTLSDSQLSMLSKNSSALQDAGRLHYMRSTALDDAANAKSNLTDIKRVNLAASKGSMAIKQARNHYYNQNGTSKDQVLCP
jgi:hypothetical protein